jgi:hypothetical protein
MSETKSGIILNNIFCVVCNYTANRPGDLIKHIKTIKHQRNLLIQNNNNQLEDKSSINLNLNIVVKKNNCSLCNYTTFDNKDFKKHLLTQKHKKNEENKKMNNSKISNLQTDETNYKELLMESLKQNKETREFMFKQHEIIEKQQKTINELIPKIGNNTINSNNKFNLNIFLNETCKDAISMEEFINKIEVSLSDLFYTKNKGIAEGVSNIFIENLNKIPITQRPIHCTDVKRETIYIKNEQWEKDENKEKTKDAIKKVSNIQIKNINKFKSAHPNFMENETEKYNYVRIVNAITANIEDKEDKVIKSICKNIYIKDDLLTEN